MKPVLLHLPYSPWSERAKWALDAKKIDYEPKTFEPVIGEPALRRLRGKAGGASVPVLIDGDIVHTDSTEIARWADTHGTGPTLFPVDHGPEIDAIIGISDRALFAGRALALARVLQSPDALMDLIPRALRFLGPVARASAAIGVRRTLRKYGATSTSDAEHRVSLVEALDALRARVAKATDGTLLGAFTYADITAAQALVFVCPPAKGLRIGKASARAFRDDVLATEYADLLAWRDALYAAHR